MANMKYQKQRIDGSDVIMPEPQHLDGTEYVNTGTSNPLPTKDESVEARLQAIEQTQSQILDKLNDTIDTRLTGSKVEQIKERKIRSTGSSYIDVIPPLWASGALIQLVVHGVTGSFESGQGANINLFSRNIPGVAQSNFYQATTERINKRGNTLINILPYTYNPTSTSQWNLGDTSIQAPITPFTANISINGTFGSGEGVECQLVVIWIP